MEAQIEQKNDESKTIEEVIETIETISKVERQLKEIPQEKKDVEK